MIDQEQPIDDFDLRNADGSGRCSPVGAVITVGGRQEV